jgi:predicted transcriptional regulator
MHEEVDRRALDLVDSSVDEMSDNGVGAQMASTTVRVSEETHELLRELAAATGEPMQRVLERAVENYRREQFFAELNAAYARLQADPVAWEEELAERALLENTLADGLDDL